MEDRHKLLGWICEENSNNRGERNITLLLILSFLIMMSWGEMGNWVYTHWLFNYEFGFIKRSMMGQLIKLFGIPTDYESIRAVCAILAVLLIASLLFFFTRIASIDNTKTGGWLFALFWLTLPATLPHHLFDMGRLDTPSLIISVYSISATIYLKEHHITALLLTVITSTALILIHEANFLLFVPILIATWLYQAWEKFNIQLVVILIMGLSWLVWLELYIAAQSFVPGFSLDSFYEHLKSISPHADRSAANVLFREQAENISYSTNYWTNAFALKSLSFFFLGLSPSFILIFLMIKSVYSNRKIRLPDIILFGAVLSPILVCAIGVDHYRWLSIALTHLGIALVIVALHNKTTATLCHTLFQQKGFLLICMAIHFALGPLEVMLSFEIFWRFSDRIMDIISVLN